MCGVFLGKTIDIICTFVVKILIGYDKKMQKKNFIKKTEDFICGHCEASVRGNGYTNHCPRCLWSKHADIIPGDRAAECGGLMEPAGIEKEHGEFVIVHKCVKCGYIKKNKAGKDDNFEEIIKISLVT